MKKPFLILFFLCVFAAFSALAEEIEIDSEVLSVNPDLEFFIIAAGEDQGIEIGDGLIVYRDNEDNEKVASAFIIEVRGEVSAAEIFEIEDNEKIHEGDAVLLVKDLSKPARTWAMIGAPRQSTKSTPRPTSIPELTEQGEEISVNISKDAKSVFSYSNLILKENNYSIISSNRATGTLLAKKPINLSLLKELWADAVAAIDHNLVVSIAIKGHGGSSELTISSFKEHSQKDRYIKRAILKNSKYYGDIVDLVHKIKERSEY